MTAISDSVGEYTLGEYSLFSIASPVLSFGLIFAKNGGPWGGESAAPPAGAGITPALSGGVLPRCCMCAGTPLAVGGVAARAVNSSSDSQLPGMGRVGGKGAGTGGSGGGKRGAAGCALSAWPAPWKPAPYGRIMSGLVKAGEGGRCIASCPAPAAVTSAAIGVGRRAVAAVAPLGDEVLRRVDWARDGMDLAAAVVGEEGEDRGFGLGRGFDRAGREGVLRPFPRLDGAKIPAQAQHHCGIYLACEALPVAMR